MAVNVCKYNQKGFCKFGDKCYKRHVIEICRRSDCSDQTCEYRHPQMCRYFIFNRSCKFQESCAYLHQDTAERTELVNLREKLLATEAKVVRLELELSEIKKLVVTESVEANVQIANDISKNLEDDSIGFKCDFCDFKSNRKAGLTIHIGKKPIRWKYFS